MVPTALLALALLLGGRASQTGALLNAVSAVWGAAGLEAGKHAGPVGGGGHSHPGGATKAGGSYDPNGLSAPGDAGGSYDPDGASALESDAGNSYDPDG